MSSEQHQTSKNCHPMTCKQQKAPLLDSHSQTPKLIAKPRGEATTKQKAKQNTTKQTKTKPWVSHSWTRHIHSATLDIIDRTETDPWAKSTNAFGSETKIQQSTSKPVGKLPGLSEPKARVGHVAWRGGKCGLSNKPIFPQPLCLSQQHKCGKEPEAHASGACLLQPSS